MSVFLIVSIAVVVILIVTGTVLYLVQDRMIFHAQKLPVDYEFAFKGNFEEFNLTSSDGQTLNGLLFRVDNPKGLILFYHNHSGNIEHWSRVAFYFNQLNYDTLLMDFRGYGKSTGSYNEKLMYKDAVLWYDFAKTKYDEDRITLYGRGIGTAFATYIASLNKPKILILESPLYDMAFTSRMHYPYMPFLSLLSKYKFATSDYIQNVACKTYIIHGELNTLVACKNSLKLKEMNKENIDLLIVPDGNHYNLVNHSMYLNKMNEILQ